jgi:hypothetical protein
MLRLLVAVDLSHRLEPSLLLSVSPREPAEVAVLAEAGPLDFDRSVPALGAEVVGEISADAPEGTSGIRHPVEHRLALSTGERARTRLAEDRPTTLTRPSERDPLSMRLALHARDRATELLRDGGCSERGLAREDAELTGGPRVRIRAFVSVFRPTPMRG